MDARLIVFIVACLLIILGGLWYAHHEAKKKGLERQTGKPTLTERAITRKLRKIGRFRGWKVLEKVSLPTERKDAVISQVVVGRFGVIVVESRSYLGQVYANQSDKNWVHVNADERETFDNLLTKSEEDAKILRRVFAKSEIYRVEIYRMVIFSGHKLELYVPPTAPVYTTKRLRKVFKQPQYRAERGVDVERICEVLKNPPKLK